MATAERVFWETVSVLAFLVLLGVAWWFSGYRAERRLASAREEQRTELAAREVEHRESLRRVDEARRAAESAHQRAEAEALFRGYSAGLQPAVIPRWRRYLGASRDELLANEPRVVFLHLATPGGFILTSTDVDLAARGKLADDSNWVLETEKIETRDGEGGVLELAGPVLQDGSPIAYLWIGYEVGVNAATN